MNVVEKIYIDFRTTVLSLIPLKAEAPVQQIIKLGATALDWLQGSVCANHRLLCMNREIALASTVGVILVAGGMVATDRCSGTQRKIAYLVQILGLVIIIGGIATLFRSSAIASHAFSATLGNKDLSARNWVNTQAP